jgi:phenylacetate-CoA ligase
MLMMLWIIEKCVRLLMPRTSTHKLLLIPGIEPLRWWLGRMRAWRTFERSARRVPAYRQFLARQNAPRKLNTDKTIKDAFSEVPEMDKDSYIKQWSIPERCVDGKLPRRGVIVDESSGSSGTPTSWVRGSDERQLTRQLLQLGYENATGSLARRPFVLNAFSLGAWATGMNVTSSLSDTTMVKSIGPDPTKIINTIQEFGPEYTYVITSYPPFLKALFDDDRLDWSQYDIIAAFGGEGISESMRDHILKTARSVLGSYGASDLEINVSLETDFTVALRRALEKHPELAEEISRKSEYGMLPMIFQFNPFNYLIETNDAGEILVTIAREENINPRIRYNIHDRGHVVRMSELKRTLRRLGLTRILPKPQLDLPLLFHYGRSDMSIDYNGATVSPDTLRDAIQMDPELIRTVLNHRLISFEDERGDRQLHIALQLNESESLSDTDQEQYSQEIMAALRSLNGDFNNAVKTSDSAMLPTLWFYNFRTGPFSDDGQKLKNEYVAHLDANDIARAELNRSWRATKQN